MSSLNTSPRGDRVNICSSKHDIYKQLIEGTTPPFKTMKDLFLTASAIGIQKQVRTPLEKKVGIFSWSQFTVQEDIPFMYALVLSLGEPLETLLDHGKILDILEEYANAGVGELAQELLSTTRPSLTLVNKILNEAPYPPNA